MGTRTLVVRADTTVAMGMGHVMRCLALAHAWQDTGGRVIFAVTGLAPAVRDRLISENIEISEIETVPGSGSDAVQVRELARRCAAAWVVVDGYHFGADYQCELKADGLHLLFVDDNGHALRYSADMVLNQNAYADETLYRDREPQTRLLLGSRYAMLRREFARWRGWMREHPPVGHKVLVTMGGSDPENVTESIIRALHLLKVPFQAKVVVGSSNPHGEALESAVGRSSSRIELIRNPGDMPQLMAWSDIAIAAAGSTCWEICLLGLPALLIDLAPNQRAIARELHSRHCAIHLGSVSEISPEKVAAQLESLSLSPETRTSLSCNARELVDGLGAGRVVAAILGGEIRLRRAEERDSHLLLEWANDPAVRAASFSSALIAREQHEAWFRHKQNDPNCRILVGEDANGRPVGQFRVDWRLDGEGEIAVSISPDCRGFGYGNLLIELGTRRAFSETKGQRLHAFVKPDNEASRRTFERAGFSSVGEERVNGQQAVHYVRAREQGNDEG